MSHRGVRGPEFINYISNLVTLGKLNPEYVKTITSPESMNLYATAFTSASADAEHNYEPLEFIGDATMNKIIVWYLIDRFPQFMNPENVKTMARLKINMIGKTTFAHLARELGTERFITCSDEEWVTSKTKLLEDTLEAVIGALELQIDTLIYPGSGYSICYNILKPVLDKIDISLKHEDLYDAVTRLKEVFDAYSKIIGKLQYVTEQTEGKQEFTVKVFSEKDRVRSEIGRGYGRSKKGAQNAAAENAIHSLSEKGFLRVPGKENFVSRLQKDARVTFDETPNYVRATVAAGNVSAVGIGHDRDSALNRAAYMLSIKL